VKINWRKLEVGLLASEKGLGYVKECAETSGSKFEIKTTTMSNFHICRKAADEE
jgi:hypothetical protein